MTMQIKHDVPFTENDEQFKEVLQAFWKDYKNTDIFDKTKDKLIKLSYLKALIGL
jgi:catabolite regulation protein CreA